MKTFHVHEHHVDGTTTYEPGDKREADENEVRHLVDLGVLADKPLANKAEGRAPANKGA